MSSRSTLVFLHAFGAAADAWRDVIERLPSDIGTLALDLPGFGGRPDSVQADSVNDYADWVEAEVARRRLDDFVLVGWSMGGKIALAAASRGLPGLLGLILVAPSPPGPEPMAPGARDEERESFHDAAAARGALSKVAGPDIPQAALDEAVAERMGAARSAWDFWLDVGSRENLSPDAGALALPILVITGEADPHLGPAESEKLVLSRLPGARMVVIEGAGHLIPLEAPARLAEALMKAQATFSTTGLGS